MSEHGSSLGTRALVLAALSALFPTLLVLLVVIPSFAPFGFAPGKALTYGLLGGWLLSALGRTVFVRRFTRLERGVVDFWARTLLFIHAFFTVLGAFPLLVLPALSQSLGWPFFTSALYLRSAALLVTLSSGLAVWSLWRHYWASLVASADAREIAA